MDRHYKIADLAVCMDAYGRSLRQAEPYLSIPVEQPDIIIRDEYQYVQQRGPGLSADECRYVANSWSFSIQLMKYNGFVLHSSAVEMDGQAYLFTANSGTGKSTHTKLWLEQFGSRARILNDDKPALRLVDGVWYAYGTPWSGKSDLNYPGKVPLAGICSLNRGETNRICRLPTEEAVKVLFRQIAKPSQRETAERLLSLLDQLFTEIPFWHLECNMDPEAALVSYKAMSGMKG